MNPIHCGTKVSRFLTPFLSLALTWPCVDLYENTIHTHICILIYIYINSYINGIMVFIQ